MTIDRRNFLRNVMELAWNFARADRSRTFANCLRGAWRMATNIRAAAQELLFRADRNGRLWLAPVGYSPVARALSARPHRRVDAQRAGYLTAQIGQ